MTQQGIVSTSDFMCAEAHGIVVIMKKKRKVIICLSLALALTLFFGSAPCMISAAGSSSITSESIKKKESQISAKQKEKQNLQTGLTDLQKLKNSLEKQKENLAGYVRELDANLAQIEQNIIDLQNQISGKEEEIQQTEQELESALEQEEFQKETVTASIRLIYEAGNPNMMEMMLKAKNFSDFLNKAAYVEKVLSYGYQQLKLYEDTRKYVELCKEELELERDILNETIASVEKEQHTLEELIEQKRQDITSYEADIRNKEKVIKEYQEEIKAQEEEIKLLEAAVAEEKKKLLESQKLTYDGGVFKFPLAKYTRISDEYGMRMHPILKVEQFHNGVDFAAPKGTAIYAAYDGRVTAATYSSTMGNYVMIDHGDGLFTIYMHASVLYVKKGQVVVKGEKIAGVGTTGRSTGNHLHFSVRLNGEYVSPWNYLKQ